VFLKSLTLKGFKSFADTTTLDFEPGVTVVVGPNGSGKSNVVDAVAWVLGAQGPRTLRSAKMEDVIFAGTPKRAALGRAEVSLTIDNSSGLLPIGFSEVTITRTLFRTGDSEYAINQVPCRLLDVQELLSDTGVGRQQHVIVSQGNLDAVLASRPEDRRLVIEEAAGVLKYRRRKERSERRLDSTEASLQRLNDLLREVRRQLRPLEKQAAAARRHTDLVEELTALRRFLIGRELVSIEARLSAAAGSRQELAGSEQEIRSALARIDAEVLAGEAELVAARERSGDADLAEAVSRAERLAARARGAVALLEQRRRNLERELAVSIDAGVVASLEAEAATLGEQLHAVDASVAGLVPEEAELVAAEAEIEAEAAAVEAQWGSDAPVAGDPAAEVRGELSARRAAADRARGERNRLESRLADVGRRVDRLEAELAAISAEAATIDSDLPSLRSVAAEAAGELEVAEAERAAAEDRRRAADEQANRWQARAEALGQALDEARARAGAERLAGVAGVVGTLLELVEVDQGWQAAFEAAAGEALAAVVVDGTSSAGVALARLREGGVGGAVAPLSEVGPISEVETFPAGAGGEVSNSGPAGHGPGGDGSSGPVALPGTALPQGAEAVRARVHGRLPRVEGLLDALLGRAVAVAGWEPALEVAAAHPGLVVVTLEGDRFAGGIWRAGAGGVGATGAALEEARSAAAEAAERAVAAAADLRSRTEVVASAREAAARAARAADTAAARARTLGESRRRAESELEDARRDVDSAHQQLEEGAARITAESERVEELEAVLPALEARAAAEAERAMAARAARARVSDRRAALAALRRDLEVRAAGVEERRGLLARRLVEVEKRLERNVAEREQATRRRRALAGERAVVERLSTVVGGWEEALAGAVGRLRDARRNETERTRSVSERLDDLRRQRTAAERQASEIRERSSRVELDDAEARVRLEALVESVRRDLDCEPEATRDAECPELPAGTSPVSRRNELEQELRLMGPINLLALEELTALQERHAFLEAQLEDVRGGRRELSKVIKAIDEEIVEVFRQAYADVSDNFEKLFATLFPGGQGRLRLTDPDHLLETGIEIEARPSGKNVRRLSLLSGGERSLVAMAFLFAVFRSRPSPFYLMDEVEAALDDLNLHRFLDLVHEFRDEAQLLIVSHQKRTMEAADCLYGVTMPPGGSSRVVSERVGSGPRRAAGSPSG